LDAKDKDINLEVLYIKVIRLEKANDDSSSKAKRDSEPAAKRLKYESF